METSNFVSRVHETSLLIGISARIDSSRYGIPRWEAAYWKAPTAHLIRFQPPSLKPSRRSWFDDDPNVLRKWRRDITFHSRRFETCRKQVSSASVALIKI